VLGAAAEEVGSGWRRRSWSAIVARRARCARNGFPFFNGAAGSETQQGNWSEMVISLEHVNGASSLAGCRVSGGKVNENKAEGTSGEWLQLTRIPWLSSWADADNGDWPPLVDIDKPAAKVEVTSVQECKKRMSCVGGGASTLVDNGAVELPLSEVLIKSSPLNPEATVFVPQDSVSSTLSDVPWLREIVEFQKQHIAHLLGQIHAMSQGLAFDSAGKRRAATLLSCSSPADQVSCAESGTNTELASEACEVPPAQQKPIEAAAVSSKQPEVLSVSCAECGTNTESDIKANEPPTAQHPQEKAAADISKQQEELTDAVSGVVASAASGIIEKCNILIDAKIADLELRLGSAQAILSKVAEVPVANIISEVGQAESAVKNDAAEVVGAALVLDGIYVQLQCLSKKTLNGLIGYVLGSRSDGRFAVYVPAERKRMSNHCDKLRILSHEETLVFFDSPSHWKQGSQSLVQLELHSFRAEATL